jgi:hypothetical protein
MSFVSMDMRWNYHVTNCRELKHMLAPSQNVISKNEQGETNM